MLSEVATGESAYLLRSRDCIAGLPAARPSTRAAPLPLRAVFPLAPAQLCAPRSQAVVWRPKVMHGSCYRARAGIAQRSAGRVERRSFFARPGDTRRSPRPTHRNEAHKQAATHGSFSEAPAPGEPVQEVAQLWEPPELRKTRSSDEAKLSRRAVYQFPLPSANSNLSLVCARPERILNASRKPVETTTRFPRFENSVNFQSVLSRASSHAPRRRSHWPPN